LHCRFCEQCLKSREDNEKEKEEKAKAREERERKAKEKKEGKERAKEEKDKDKQERARKLGQERLRRDEIERGQSEEATKSEAEKQDDEETATEDLSMASAVEDGLAVFTEGMSAEDVSEDSDSNANRAAGALTKDLMFVCAQRPSQKARAAAKTKADATAASVIQPAEAPQASLEAVSGSAAPATTPAINTSAAPAISVHRIVNPPPPSGTFAYGSSTQEPPGLPLPPPGATQPPLPFYAPHPYSVGIMPPYAVQGPNGETYPPAHAFPYGYPIPAAALARSGSGSPPNTSMSASGSGSGNTGKDGSPTSTPTMAYPPYPYPFYQLPPAGHLGAPSQGYASYPIPLPFATPNSSGGSSTKNAANAAEVQWSPFAPQPASGRPLSSLISSSMASVATSGVVGQGIVWAEVRFPTLSISYGSSRV
jgi:hypothetical protein